MRRLRGFILVVVVSCTILAAEVSCGAGPASYMFEGPLKPLSSERVAAPKVPKEFEEEAKWHREAADEEATGRRLQGGVSGPASWQYNKPLNAKIWQKMQPALPRDTRETHGGTARRLAGVDGGVSGPASWQYYHPLNAKVWQKMQPALPRETRETHGGTARRLAGVDESGPSSYAFGPTELPKRGQLPRDPTFERHAFPKWVINPTEIKNAEDVAAGRVDRKLLDGGASGPASEMFAIGAVPVELPFKGDLPTAPDFEHRAMNDPVLEETVAADEARASGARLLLGGGSGPDSWQRWGGKPDYEKVWQMQQPALPRGQRETHGGSRKLMGGVSGPASWQYYHPLNAKIWQKMQPALPRETRETHGGTARRLAGVDGGGQSGPASDMFAAFELPKKAKLPTEPDFERRAVTKPGQVQKPEARASGARLLLGGVSGPASWQYYHPLNAKIWQKMQPALPREARESHGGTNRRLAGVHGGGQSGPASDMFAAFELPKKAKLPTEPDFERRAVTKPGQVQKPEARAGGARLLLGGGTSPDSWQRWGGKPDYEKVWQMQQPALPRGQRETHGGARKLMGDAGRFEETAARPTDVRTWQVTKAMRHLLGADSVDDRRNRRGSRARKYEAPLQVPDTDAKDTQRAVRDDAEYIPTVRYSGLA